MKTPTKILVTLTVVILCSCVVYPKKVIVYDEKCDVESEKLVLAYNDRNLVRIRRCQDEHCAAILLANITTVAVETVVAGSVVVVGNTIYWLQKQGSCKVSSGKQTT